MATNPFDQFGPAEAATNRGPVYGPPPTTTPQQAQSMDIAAANEARQAAEFEGTAGKPTVEQGQAAFLVTRVKGGIQDIEEILRRSPQSTQPGVSETILFNQLGGESLIARNLTEGDRVAIRDAQADMVDALLTLSTGAAYTPAQIEAMRVAYFPQQSDTPEQIALKKRRLERAVTGAKLRAGPLADDLEAVLAQFAGPIGGPQVNVPEMVGGLPKGSEIQFNSDEAETGFDVEGWYKETYGVTRNQASQVEAVLNANLGNKGITGADLKAAVEGLGVPTGSFDFDAMAGQINAGDFEQQGEQPAKYSQFSFDPADAENRRNIELDKEISERGVNPETMGRAVTGHALQGAAWGAGDELMGIGAAIGAAAQGENPFDAYSQERDITRRKLERSAEYAPVASLVSELAGGMTSGPVGFRGVKTVADAAKAGARTGAVAGFNYGEGPGGSAVGAGIGAATGAGGAAGMQALAPVIAKGAGAVANRFRSPKVESTQAAREAAEAAQRRGVPMAAYELDLTKAPAAGRVSKTEGGQPIFEEAREQSTGAIQQTLSRDVAGGAQAVERETAGRGVQAAIGRAQKAEDEIVGALYRRVDKLAPDFQTSPSGSVKYLDAEIEQALKKGLEDRAAVLGELREHLTGKGLSVASMQGMRQIVRDAVGKRGLSMGPEQAIATKAQRMAGNELASAMEARGMGGAEKILSEANKRVREAHDFEDKVLVDLFGSTGNKSAKQVFDTLKGWGQNDRTRLSRVLSALPEEERRQFAATIAMNIGNRDGNFSFQAFQKAVLGDEGMNPTLPRATQELLFGKEGVAAIDDLRKIITQKQAAIRGMQTGGPTQGAVGRGVRTMIITALTAGAGAMAGDGTGAIAGVVLGPGISGFVSRLGDARAARLLTNPDFTKWLKTLPETTNPAAINKSFERLNSIAARSPVMTEDVLAFTEALKAQFSPGDNNAPIPAR